MTVYVLPNKVNHANLESQFPILGPMTHPFIHRLCIVVACFTLAACGSSTRNAVQPRFASENVVRVWKSELDSGNVPQAISFMAHPSGRRYVAVEAYELRDDVARWQRILHRAILSDIIVEIETDSSCRLLVEMDYHDMYLAQTHRIDSSWYLTSFRSRMMNE